MDGELNAIMDSAFDSKGATTLSTSSSLLKIIIDSCEVEEGITV